MEWYVSHRAGDYVVVVRESLDPSDATVAGPFDRRVALAVAAVLRFADQDAPPHSYISWRRFWSANCALAQLDPVEDERLSDVFLAVRGLVDRDSWSRPEDGR